MTCRAIEFAGMRLPTRGGYDWAHRFPLPVEAMQASRASPRPAPCLGSHGLIRTPATALSGDRRIARMLRGLYSVQAFLTGRKRAELFFHAQVPFAGFR